MPQSIHRADHTGGPRRCAHVAAAPNVEPLSTGCPQCREHGEGWVELAVLVVRLGSMLGQLTKPARQSPLRRDRPPRRRPTARRRTPALVLRP